MAIINKLEDIADAIREKTGGNNLMTMAQMPDEIRSISGGGETPTPVITVSTAGLITATAGDKTATQQLDTQAAKTVTPGTSQQTAVASQKYTTGAVTVAGDADLVASNILSTANIFGVQGNVVISHWYTGTSDPASSLGASGDLYFQGS